MGGKFSLADAEAFAPETIGGTITLTEGCEWLARPAPTRASAFVCQPNVRLQNPRLASEVAKAIVLSFLFMGRMTMGVVFFGL